MAIKKPKHHYPYPIFVSVLLLRAPRRLGLLRSLLLKGLNQGSTGPPLTFGRFSGVDTSEMPFFLVLVFFDEDRD